MYLLYLFVGIVFALFALAEMFAEMVPEMFAGMEIVPKFAGGVSEKKNNITINNQTATPHTQLSKS